MPAAFEVCGTVESEAAREGLVVVGVEQLRHPVGGPHVILAFLSLGVGVARGGEAAFDGSHVRQHPVRGESRHVGKVCLAGRLKGLRVEGQQQAVVVQHLLEVRDLPLPVDGVAAESSADVVEDPAFGHAAQGVRRHPQRVGVRFGAVSRAQQPGDRLCVGKLRRRAKTAEVRVEGPGEPAAQGGKGLGAGRFSGRLRRRQASEHLDEPLTLCAHLVAPLGIVARDAGQQLAEGRQAVARRVREVGAAEERAPVLGIEKHRERPAAAALSQQLLGGLVDLVDVRALLAVDLDVDEQVIHQLGGGRVLEGFVCHDVTPVAGRIADGEQHGSAGLACVLEGVVAPRIPVHGVVGVLQQVGAGFVTKAIAHPLL